MRSGEIPWSRSVSVVLTGALVGAFFVACAEPPRPSYPTGEPAPSASTSAEPLWLRNRP